MSLLAPAEICLVDHLTANDIDLPPVRLVDVGCSGGIYPAWRRWRDRLSALGIDVITDEVERLSQGETNPNVHYIAARAGRNAPAEKTERFCSTTYALHRSQAYFATALLRAKSRPDSEEFFRAFWRTIVRKPNPPFEANYSNVTDPSADPFFAYYLERFGAKRDPVLATRVADVDALAAEAGHVDVLKIDTDGYDFDVLCGATRTLSSCVAVEIEVQFQGPVSDDANVFCNIDRLLRKEGFSLFKLAPVHYARSALPRPFLYDIPANNVAGPLAWGDALYVRDVGVAPNDATTKDKLRSLALVLDIYGLEDAAAEILLSHPDLFGPSARALDFLAAKLYGSDISYSDVVTRFCQDPIRSPAR